MKSRLGVVAVALTLVGCGSSGGRVSGLDYTSAAAIASALDSGGFSCASWRPNPQAIMVRESGYCTHADSVISVSTYNDADQMKQFDKVLKDSGLSSGVMVEGDVWQVNAKDKEQAIAVQRILGGTVN